MLDPGSPDGVRNDDKYVRLVFANRRSISQACVGNTYAQRLYHLVMPDLSRYPVNLGAINFRRSKYLAPMLDPGSPDGVRDDDKYVRLVLTNRSCIPQVCVGNAYTQHSSTISSYRL